MSACINTEVKEKGQKLETVTSLNYLGSFVTDEGSKPEILSRMAQTTAALTRLKPVWNDRSIYFGSNVHQMCSLVTSIFQYACESWNLTAKLQRRIQAVKMRCYSKILRISDKDHATSEEIHAKVQQAVTRRPDHCKEAQTIVVWTCLPFIRSGKTILQGTVKGGRRQGRQKKRWEDNIRSGVHQVPEGEQGKMEKTSCEIICGAPTTLPVKG